MINDEWTKYYTQEQLIHLHSIYKMMLNDFCEICRLLKVKFFLYGGTLLGAAKYSGFVPWDDDVDICMTRSDYTKFVKNFNQVHDSKYSLQTPYNCKQTPYFYCKFRLNGTSYIEYPNRKLKINQGIYFDIYPLDNIPDNKKEFHSFFKKNQRYLKIFSIRQSFRPSQKPSSIKAKFKSVLKFMISMLLRLIPRKVLISRMDSLFQKYNACNTKFSSCLNYPSEDSFFENPLLSTELFFEGKKYSVPTDYHSHLMRRYNDYLKDLPSNKKVGHTPYFIDFGEF